MPTQVARIAALIERNDRTGSGAFKALDESGGRWWVKPLNNPQGARIPITELIVGRVGELIEAPVCEVRVVELPEELRDEEYRPGLKMVPGYASASRDLGGCLEERDLVHRDKDDNASRQAGVFALYDWCWGSDDQWLYVPSADYQLYSHDHGLYLSGDWSEEALSTQVDTAHNQSRPPQGLRPEALRKYAEKLQSVSRAEIVGILRGVPADWPVTTTELETVGWFLERRACAVSARLQDLAATLHGGGTTT
jgi:hypothetical protein